MRFFLALLFCVLTAPALADDVIVIQPLRFGTWLFPGNSSVYTVTVETNGSYSHSPELTMISPPTEGVYDVGDLPPSSAINSLDVTQSAPLEFSGRSFEMDDMQATSIGSTDSNGRVTVTVGASAKTSGDGTGYPTGNYTGTLDLNFDINF